MASISYAGLLLLLNLMIVLLAPENTVANAHEGNILTKKWLMGSEDEALHKAVFDGTVEVISAIKPLNSGRKMLQGAVNKRSSDTTSADYVKDRKERDAFLDEADEVANLMRRDYGGKDKPKRKPPINNDEPAD